MRSYRVLRVGEPASKHHTFAPAGNNSMIALVSETEVPLLPAVLAAAAGALVLLILAGQLMRRKKKKSASAKAE